MIKCVIVDDEPLAITLLNQYIKQYDGLQLLDGFTDAIESIDFINNNEVHLLFLDILMPDITGIGLLKKLRNRPVVVFTSAHRDFAVDGYEMGVADYLLKPFDFNRFKKGVERAVEYLRLREKDNTELLPGIFIKSEFKLIKINFHDILFIESKDDYIKIHLIDAKPVITLMSLKSILEKLPPADFQRIHRRYIISIHKITSFGNKKIILNSSAEIPVGDTYQQVIQNLRKSY